MRAEQKARVAELNALARQFAFLFMRLPAALLALFSSATSVLSNDLPLARLYHLVADICINETLANKDAQYHMAMAGRSLVVHCDCVSQAANFTKDEYSSVVRGEIPASAHAMWIHWHELCINAGH
jgi:hypothetical protein